MFNVFEIDRTIDIYGWIIDASSVVRGHTQFKYVCDPFIDPRWNCPMAHVIHGRTYQSAGLASRELRLAGWLII